eukprot:TRINITY_DN6237_c0_g4_i1.p1 TRINITY_DN6237_c0_g4~~TRINITY_DN6237_c0_g4_i1.p1  ORF type:complete len:433 (+),score=180.37 TRINITY_DN6237_c0_g4_i1:67-1365(+)
MPETISKQALTWGVPTVEDKAFTLRDSEGAAIVEVPFNTITGVDAGGKTDFSVQLEYKPDDDEVMCSELKFHCPPNCEPKNAPGAGAAHVRTAAAIKKNMGKTDLGEVVCEFENLNFLAPKGTFTLQLYAAHLRIAGKLQARGAAKGGEQEFIIPMASLGKGAVYSLESPTTMDAKWLCLALTKPVKVGAQNLTVLTFQADKVEVGDDDPIEVTIAAATHEQAAARTRDGKEKLLNDKMTGLLTDIIPRALRAMSGAICVEPLKDQTDGEEVKPVQVSHVGKEGAFYQFEKSLLFAPNPTLAISHSSITDITFDGIGTGGHTVALKINRKTGQNLDFAGMNSGEVSSFVEKLRERGVTLLGLEAPRTLLDGMSSISDESMSDNESATHDDTADSSGDEAIAGAKRKRKDKKEKKAKKAKKEKKEKKSKKEKK